MIYYIYCAFYFYYFYISFSLHHQSLDTGGWGLLLYRTKEKIEEGCDCLLATNALTLVALHTCSLSPTPGVIPNPGIEPEFPVSPTIAGGFSTTAPPGKSYYYRGRRKSFFLLGYVSCGE